MKEALRRASMPSFALSLLAGAVVLLLCVLLLCVLLLSAHTPHNPYWRDGAEFVVSAFYLDIAHPAGFPLYSQLANGAALLPFGPIAWRVHLFSCLTVVIASALSGSTCWLLLTRTTYCHRRVAFLLSLLAAGLFLLHPTVTKQALVAEVYALHAVIIQLLLLLYLLYHFSADARYLISAAFVAGLGIGNHITLIIPLIPCAAIILYESGMKRKVLVPAAVFGLIGLLVYMYIPVRAATHPPLNTGAAWSLPRLASLVTDRRDQVLRAPAHTASNDHTEPSLEPLFRHFGQNFFGDMQRLAADAGIILYGCTLLGLIALALKTPLPAAAFAAMGLGSWSFFGGWDPDPWIPLISIVYVLTCYAFGTLSANNQVLYKLTAAVGALFLSFLTLHPLIQSNADNATSAQRYAAQTLPKEAAFAVLRSAPPHTIVVAEYPWFLTAWAHFVAGYRPDVTLAYQPGLLYPEYFAPVDILRSSAERFASTEAGGDPRTRLKQLLSFAGSAHSITFTPNQDINRLIHQTAAFTGNGAVTFGPPSSKEHITRYVEARSNFYNRFHRAIAGSPSVQFRSDLIHFMETAATGDADLLARRTNTAEARTLLSQACKYANTFICSEVAMNNLAVYLMRDGAHERAARLLLDQLSSSGTHAAVLKHNLFLSVSALTAEQKASIAHHPGWQYNPQIKSMLFER